MDDPAREIPELVNVLLTGIDRFAPAAAPIGNIRIPRLNGSHLEAVSCSSPVLGIPSVKILSKFRKSSRPNEEFESVLSLLR